MFHSALLALAGTVLLLFVAYDVVRTTLSASSSGPLTNRLTSLLWRLLLSLHRLRPSPGLLGGGGTWITLCLMLSWVLLFWVAWLLLFCSSVDAVVSSTTGVPASSVTERAYFVGYTLTTLGYGDFVPGAAPWTILATLASANGLFLFTLSITYALPIVSAATEKRQLALCIHAIGATPAEMLQATRGCGDFSSLATQLNPLESMIAAASQKHLAYPILHYFHSTEPVTALPLALVRLDLALELLRAGRSELRPEVQAQIDSTEHVIQQFLATLRNAFIRANTKAPENPVPELAGKLLDADPQQLKQRLDRLDKLNLLAAYIHDNGRQWQDVWTAGDGPRTRAVQDY